MHLQSCFIQELHGISAASLSIGVRFVALCAILQPVTVPFTYWAFACESM